MINEEYLQELNISKDGLVTYKSNWYQPIDFEKVLKPVAEYDIDLPLLQAVYSVFYQSIIEGNSFLDNNTLTITGTELAKYLNTNPRASEFSKFGAKCKEFENVFAFFSDNRVIKIITLVSFDIFTNTLKFDVSLLAEILRTIQDENTIVVKKPFKKEFIQELPTHSFLIHSGISRKNKNAYFLVTQIEVLLVQAGENVKNPHIRFDTLIERVPSLQKAMDNNKSSRQYKNVYLERTFNKMYELLKTSTDLYDYFIDLSIAEIIPTQSKLDEILQITHNGINKDYKPKK